VEGCCARRSTTRPESFSSADWRSPKPGWWRTPPFDPNATAGPVGGHQVGDLLLRASEPADFRISSGPVATKPDGVLTTSQDSVCPNVAGAYLQRGAVRRGEIVRGSVALEAAKWLGPTREASLTDSPRLILATPRYGPPWQPTGGCRRDP
jgi:hypothetical protein